MLSETKSARGGKIKNYQKIVVRFLLTHLLTYSLTHCLYSADWRAFRRGPERTGFAKEQAYPYTAGSVPGWHYKTFGKIASSPVVAYGMVFIGNRSGALYAFDAYTGKIIWQYSAGGWIDSSPAVYNGRIYVQCRDGNLYCLNAYTGEENWMYETKCLDGASPVISGGRVYGARGYPYKDVYIVNAETGEPEGTYSTGQYVYSSPVINDGRIFVGSNDGKLYGFNTDWEGQPKETMGIFHFATLTVGNLSNKTVVYGAPRGGDKYVYCFDTGTGAQIWKSTCPLADQSTQVSSLALSDDDLEDGIADTLYIVSGGTTYKLFALEAGSGEIKWSTPVGPSTEFDFLSSPAVANDVVYVGSGNGNLYAISTSTGGIIATYPLGSGIVSSPCIANGWIYVGTVGGYIYAFQARKIASISGPEENSVVNGIVNIKGFVINPDLTEYKLEYGKGETPGTWYTIVKGKTSQVNGGVLGSWDTRSLRDDYYTIRLTVDDGTTLMSKSFAVFKTSNETVSEFINAANGGTISLADGTEVYIPPGALKVNDTVTIKKLLEGYSEQGIPNNLRATSIVREFTLGNPVGNSVFNKLVTIKLPYTASDISGMTEKKLKMCWWDTSKSRWSIVNTSQVLDDESKVKADINHFSVYRILEFVPGGELIEEASVYTYPNPAKGNTLYFKYYLSDDAEVEINIYNIAGERIAELVKGNNTGGIVSEIPWDIENIASGTYIYHFEARSSTQNKAIKKKLAIIH
ncbi:MAG: PQQ-binding-like beta-propeller repeat protein [Elusimicrobia bacterium]|nr:PQQ-binding-like beta-propeller repeat protein [Elusimicrobiota bacterium]